jgi:hypothetical protein
MNYDRDHVLIKETTFDKNCDICGEDMNSGAEAGRPYAENVEFSWVHYTCKFYCGFDICQECESLTPGKWTIVTAR